MTALHRRLSRLERGTQHPGVTHVFCVYCDREYATEDLQALARASDVTFDPGHDDAVLLQTIYPGADAPKRDTWVYKIPRKLKNGESRQ